MKDGKPFGKGKIYLVNDKGDIEQYWEKDIKTGDAMFISASGDEVSVMFNFLINSSFMESSWMISKSEKRILPVTFSMDQSSTNKLRELLCK